MILVLTSTSLFSCISLPPTLKPPECNWRGKKQFREIGYQTILHSLWNTTTASNRHFDLMCFGRQFENYDWALMWHAYPRQSLNYSFVYLVKYGLVQCKDISSTLHGDIICNCLKWWRANKIDWTLHSVYIWLIALRKLRKK